MQFNKSDIVKMGGTAIVTALIFLALHRPPAAESFSKTPYVLQISNSTSGAISWDTAKSMIAQYLKSSNPLFVDSTKKVPLRAFVFNARQLDTVINHNLSPFGKDSSADDLYVYFGQQGTFDSGKYGKIHMIIVGAKTFRDPATNALYDSLMINPARQNSASSTSVYDKADPCPPKCPKTF